jgi:hypothetical protein
MDYIGYFIKGKIKMDAKEFNKKIIRKLAGIRNRINRIKKKLKEIEIRINEYKKQCEEK